MIKKQLLKGENCWFVSSGNSLWPVMHSGDAITLAPIAQGQTIELGDIVFAEVQYGPRFYVHMVHAIEKDIHGGKRKYWIGTPILVVKKFFDEKSLDLNKAIVGK